MYTIDQLDCVVKLNDVPQSNVGAPMPVVVANESVVAVAFLVQGEPWEWDGTAESLEESSRDNVCIVCFNRDTHMFGPPNDEVIHGHPLYERGLHAYGAFEVLQSSWIRQMERMNAVHSRHDRERFMKGKRHMILAFHDSLFECVCTNYCIERLTCADEDLWRGAVPRMVELVRDR